MAEKQSASTKRRVKNPETFRERAVKANEPGSQEGRLSKLGAVSGKTIRPIARSVRKAAGIKPLGPLRTALRIVGKILLPTYFRESWKQLRLVKWPNRTESRQLTFAVLVFAVVFGIAIAIVDFGLDHLFRDILLK